MGVPLIADISDFKRRDFTFEGKTNPVLITGEIGPAVAVIHEIYFLHPDSSIVKVRPGALATEAHPLHELLP